MASLLNFLSAETNVSAMVGSHDWSGSPLGEPAGWPLPLQAIINLVLRSTTPKYIAWGPRLCLLYNDAYLEILGTRHPQALGRPLQEVWPDIWAELEPIVARTLSGESLHLEDMAFTLRRNKTKKKAWFSFSFAPLYEADTVSGIYCDLVETTAHVLEERSRISEIKRLQQLFAQAPGSIAILQGPEHIFESANSSFMRLIGSHRPIAGKPVREALPELAEQGFPKLLDEAYASGQPFRGHALPISLRRTPQDPPHERLLDFVYQPIKDEQGAVTGIFLEAFDVTDSITSARELEASNRRLYQLANTIPQLAWIADPAGTIYWYNDRWYEYTGTTLEDMQGDGWQNIHHPDELPWVLKMWTECLQTGEAFEMTFPLKDSHGNYRPFFTQVAPMKDSSGRIEHWFGTNTDVSSLHKVQQELRKTEEWLQEGLLVGRMVAWEWNLQTDRVKYSDNSQDVLGFSSGKAAKAWQSFHPDDAEALTATIKDAVETQGEFHIMGRAVRPDNGQELWLETRGRFTSEPDGTRFMRGIIIDVTERIKAEQELKGANLRKDEFLAMLAHELRNPMAPISTAAQLLRLPGFDEERIRHSSEVIERQVKHMTELVDDLLDVSRVTRGLVTLQKGKTDLNSVVLSAVEQARPLLEARSHTLTTHVSSLRPVVYGDRTRLIQVVANVLNNAAKYTPPEGHIELDVEVLGDQVKISVTDNGIGLEPTLIPHIFELFVQAERTSDRSQGGLGLGLPLARSLVALHGGSIEIHSEGIGTGCTVNIFLPLLEQGMEFADAQAGASAANATGSLRIMIVDDNADAGETLAVLLQAHGHHTVVMTTPGSALDSAAKFQPDVFILDIGLPDMDGYELARRLKARQEFAQTLFIALTGYGQAHDKALSREAGFDHHFVKPMNITELLELLNHRTNSA